MTVALRATIDLGALERNLIMLSGKMGDAKVLAVVKADAYGHGVRACAARLALLPQCAGFAVARVGEGVHLRNAGITLPVVVLGGPAAPDELEVCVEHRLTVAVHDWAQVAWLEAAVPSHRLDVWVKLDSGMHRLGFHGDDLASVASRLERAPAVREVPVVMTHLANADDLEDPATPSQLDRFSAWTADFRGERSIANSAGVLGWPDARGDWVRPGLSLYGISPFLTGEGHALGLAPVMTLRTRLIAVKTIEAGAPVGYSGTWRAPERMPIGVAAVGYADGYPRGAAPTPVLVGDRPAATVGRVSMDLTAIDLRGIVQAKVGSEVTLWGAELPVERVARPHGRIPYELVVGLGARAAREYVG